MTTRTNIDNAGRIVIPKLVREALRIHPGDVLEIVSSEEEITLRPVRPIAPLAKEMGVWVYRSGQAIAPDAAQRLLDHAREERLDGLAP